MHDTSGYVPGPGYSMLDNAIHGINHYPVDKYQGNHYDGIIHWTEINIISWIGQCTFQTTGRRMIQFYKNN